MSTPRRRDEIVRVREEGRIAAAMGRHQQTCPYPTCRRLQGRWAALKQYHEAQAAMGDDTALRLMQELEQEL